MTKVAVVILNYNGCDLLRKFLPSVVHHSTPARIIVVDNCSTDGSRELITQDFPAVELISFATNLGFSGGYNHALKDLDADYCVLLNSDVEVTSGWLDPLIRVLDENPQAVAVQPKILAYQNKNSFEYAGAGGGFIDALGYPFCRGRLFHSIEDDLGQFNDTIEIFWASGACSMLRLKLYNEIGGLDEDFFAHMEEIDLCWRFQRAGHKIFYSGMSTVYHVGGGTLSASNPKKTYLNFKNGLSLLYKNLSPAQLIIKLPIRIMLDWVASLKFTLSGSFQDGRAVFKAHRHFLVGWNKEKIKRKQLAKIGYKKLPNQYLGSIVWDFFIAGKRKYSQLRPKNPI